LGAVIALLLGHTTAAASRLTDTPPQRPQQADQPVCVRDRVTAAFVGDVLLHDTLQLQASRDEAQGGYAAIWQSVVPALTVADITFANLEGPVAPGVRCDGVQVDDPPPISPSAAVCSPGNRHAVYTHFPLFNYPPAILDALSASGVDIVSTGNNHALDRYSLGVDLTLNELDRRGLAHVGTHGTGTSGPTYAITAVAGEGGTVTLAWVACSYTDNGLPDPHNLLSRCYDESGSPDPALVNLVRRLHSRPTVDAVVVTPHWGHEYDTTPSERQRLLAGELAAAGATALVGTHPHVLQPLEVVPGLECEVPVMYSLGNFVADQPLPTSRVSVVLYLDFVTREDGATCAVSPRYLPVRTARIRSEGRTRLAVLTLDQSSATDSESSAALRTVAHVLPEALRLASDDTPAVTNGPGRCCVGCGCCGQDAYLYR
jgi:poly-gamma-glutamate synthesis protein (capsule biosynthesis protein)